MDQIPVRVLNQDTAGVLARVENGESLEVTSRGRAVARIVPVGPTGNRQLDALIAAGRVIPATARSPFVAPTGVVDSDRSASEALIAMRDEERW